MKWLHKIGDRDWVQVDVRPEDAREATSALGDLLQLFNAHLFLPFFLAVFVGKTLDRILGHPLWLYPFSSHSGVWNWGLAGVVFAWIFADGIAGVSRQIVNSIKIAACVLGLYVSAYWIMRYINWLDHKAAPQFWWPWAK